MILTSLVSPLFVVSMVTVSIEALVSLFFDWTLLGQIINLKQILGAMLIIIGIVIMKL